MRPTTSRPAIRSQFAQAATNRFGTVFVSEWKGRQMPIPTREPMLLDREDVAAAKPAAVAVVKSPEPDSVALMFERLARDPSVDVEKLERLIGMQERIMAHNSRAAFNVAFSAMQGEIPAIAEKGKTDKGTY